MYDSVLSAEDLCISYGNKSVVKGIEFNLKKGHILAVTGESGCGKSTLLKAIIGTDGLDVSVNSGKIVFGDKIITGMDRMTRKKNTEGKIGMIFQDPGSSFNPIRPYRKQFEELFKSRDEFRGKETFTRIEDSFIKLDLPDNRHLLDRCPYELSGGMNQRIAIAAAMLSEPELLLLDEPTSALDMTSQKAVLDELLRLRKITGMTMIIVTHNLSVAARLADETAVMYAGRFVEYGKTGGILGNPYHPYTSELMRSVPVLGGSMPEGPDGFLHLADDNQQGCAYFDRCRYASDICKTNDGKLRELSQDHFTSCIGRRTYD